MVRQLMAARAGRAASIAVPVLAAMVTAAASSAAQVARHPAATPGWRVLKTFTVKNLDLGDVAGFSDRSLWAGGSTPSQTPVLYHLASGTWKRASLPGGTGSFVGSLSATSPANVWAALENEPDVARLTSTGWKLTPFVSGTDQIAIDGVATTGPKNTWAFTYDFATKQATAEHYNGSTWKAIVLPASVDGGSQVGLVSASGPGNIWAWAYNAVTKKFTTLHYDGHQWATRAIPVGLVPNGQSLDPEQMLALSPDNVWATANNNMSSGTIILLHWNGHSWSKTGGKLPAGELAGPIASDGAGGLWLEAYNPHFTYFLLHFAHDTWTKVGLPADQAGPVRLYSLRLIAGTTSVLGAGLVGQNPGGTTGSVVVKYGR